MNPTLRLLALLRDIRPAAALSPADWSEIVAAARSTNLLGTLAERLAAAGIRAGCGADRHLEGARQLSMRQHGSVHWEAQCIDETLAPLGAPIVLLKGSAYVMGGHRASRGRMFGDIDILVPSPHLASVELRLMMNGWTSGKLDSYDQRYYRRWMHELPPLHHVRRGTVIDVHHTILPRTARHHPKAQSIIDRATRLPGFTVLCLPCVEDLLIHSITHLMHEGDLGNGLRDLQDIDTLISDHGSGDFWSRFIDYAREHDLSGPVGLGLQVARACFGTTVPDWVVTALAGATSPGLGRRQIIHLFDLAMRYWPDHDRPATARLAGSFVYLRAHALRMPPWLLIPHLARKALMRFKEAGGPTEPRQ